MEKFSEEFLTEVLRFYKEIGLNKPDFLRANNILGMYEILGIRPEYDEFGNRRLTPYEILGVPPIIVNGREVPIVFAIKNKTKKVKRIGTIDGPIVDFVYKNKKVKEKDSLLEQLKKKYKEALLAGDEELAAQFLQMIDELTGGRSVEFLHSFYDYTQFYRRMKKQLLIDLFNHFFLMFLMQNSITVKEGIIKKGKVFKAFKDENEQQKQEEISDFQMGQKLLGGKGSPKISKISISRGDEGPSMPKTRPAPTAQRPEPKPVPKPEPVRPKEEPEEKPERSEKYRNGYLNRRRRFGRFRKYEPFEDALEQTILTPPPIIPEPILEDAFETFKNVADELIMQELGEQFNPEKFAELNKLGKEETGLQNNKVEELNVQAGEDNQNEEIKEKVEELQREQS